MKNTTMYYENYDDDIKCETCGMCHIDGLEAQDCWASKNDPDYDPFDI